MGRYSGELAEGRRPCGISVHLASVLPVKSDADLFRSKDGEKVLEVTERERKMEEMGSLMDQQ